jgi:hypothetical protein
MDRYTAANVHSEPRSLTVFVRYAPASGRLAAAIATSSARRRPIREGAERSNVRICCMTQVPPAPGETVVSRKEATSAEVRCGAVARMCRGRSKNSNTATASPARGSGFIAATTQAMGEIFSGTIWLLRLNPGSGTLVVTRYPGGKPKACWKRLT